MRDNDHQSGVGQLKYDSTTNNDFKDGVPEIMVTYKDARTSATLTSSLMDLSQLSISELKQRLRERGIDHASCVERSDLVELLRRRHDA